MIITVLSTFTVFPLSHACLKWHLRLFLHFTLWRCSSMHWILGLLRLLLVLVITAIWLQPRMDRSRQRRLLHQKLRRPRISLADQPQRQLVDSNKWKHLRMELFTLWKEINLQLGSPDFVRQTFTMEAFTLWSPTFSFDSISMEAPSPKGEPHLRLETFTLCPHTMVNSFACFPQVGIAAPCTNSVYKAAHRNIRLATVSPPQSRPWTIANQPYFVFSFLFCSSPVFKVSAILRFPSAR